MPLTTPVTREVPGEPPEHCLNDLVYSYRLDSWLAYGEAAANIVANEFPAGVHVGVDIETAGLDENRFSIRCVTASWRNTSNNYQGSYISVILDPRVPDQKKRIRQIMDNASALVFHGGTFDIPVMVMYELMSLESIEKVWDTLVLSKQLYSGDEGRRTLEAVVDKLTSMNDGAVSINTMFKAMGLKNKEFEGLDINSPTFARGAMADTLGTLMIFQPLYENIVKLYLNYYASNKEFDETFNQDKAQYLIEREQVTNRTMIRRSSLGIKVNRDYLAEYAESVKQEMEEAKKMLWDEAGIDAESGNSSSDVVDLLDKKGILPADWEKTATGKLSASKKKLGQLDHPYVKAVLGYRYSNKVLGYLEKVDRMSTLTGRLYPQVYILGASATGRMSYSSPELQQFPDEARPILVPDDGDWVSIDWSSIEPVVIGNVAQDHEFIQPFTEGHDLYVPLGQQAGMIPAHLSEEEAKEHPARKQIKTMFLAILYGRGVKSTAKELNVSMDAAKQMIKDIKDAMPKISQTISKVQSAAGKSGLAMTVDGRVLRVPKSMPYADGQMPKDPFSGYKAGNYLVQGTAYSMLSESINEMHRRGIGDALYLAVHDEIIVAEEYVDEVREIMETAPGWLKQAVGSDVFLATDSNKMNGHWRYV